MIKVFLYNMEKQTEKPSVYAHRLLKELLAGELGTNADKLRFSKHEQGKPYLSSHPQIHFNISHSFIYLAIAISNAPIGIDVEKIRTRNYQAVLSRYFASSETEYILSLPLEQQNKAFIQLWTLKESFLKYKGCGIANNIQNYPIEMNYEKKAFQMAKNTKENVFFDSRYIGKEYYMSICSPLREIPFVWEKKNF